jgi:hypothetical protein
MEGALGRNDLQDQAAHLDSPPLPPRRIALGWSQEKASLFPVAGDGQFETSTVSVHWYVSNSRGSAPSYMLTGKQSRCGSVLSVCQSPSMED